MTGLRVLITGASGFIGQALCRYAGQSGWAARGALRTVATLPDGVESVVVGELSASTDWARALDGIGVVIHLAARQPARDSVAKDALDDHRRVNVLATLHLARQAAAAGVRRFVFLSSVKVNGEGRDWPYHEHDIPAPQDAYGISKWEAEQGLQTIAKETGMEVVIIRPPLVYGPGAKGNFANLVHWVCKGVPLPLGAVDNRRSLIALDNLVSFIALCADPAASSQAANEVFLISDGEDVSTPELIRRVAQAFGMRPRLWAVPPAWLRLGARLLGRPALAERLLDSLMVDSSKARALLGWRPVVTMDEQLAKMARHDTGV